MSIIKIFEMFMRDGLQSLSKIYTLQQKNKFIDKLSRCNYHAIEFGSSTSAKLLPQMANGYDIWNHITQSNNHLLTSTKYTLLTPGLTHIEKALDNKINSFGLVCSVSDKFAHNNLNKTSNDTLINVFTQSTQIINKDPNAHIRIYLSCSFGSPWEKFDLEYKKRLFEYVEKIIKFGKTNKLSSDNFDIVISDTVGLSTCERTSDILNNLTYNIFQDPNDIKYIGLHLHTNSTNNSFKNLIDNSLKYNISKFDSSLLGIGGCPFAEDNSLGNCSTIKLVEHIEHVHKLNTGINLDILKLIEEEIKIEL